MRRKPWLLSTLAAAVAAVSVLQAAPARAELDSITIGTNPSGTLYNVFGGLFAKMFQEQLKVRSTAQPHAGSSVYLPLLNKGEITMGLNSSLDSALAYNGQEPYGEALTNVRALARFWVLPYAYFARGDSGLTSVDQLKGKRVVVNFKANVALANLNRTMVTASGLSLDDVTVTEISGIPDGIDAVVEGRVDAATIAIGVPIFQKAHTTTPGGLRILSLPESVTDDMMNAGTKGSRTTVVQPSDRNAGVVGPTKVAAFESYINITGSVSEEDGYLIAKTLHQNWGSLDHPVLQRFKPDEIVPQTNVVPYHPGAVKYYKEAGIWSDGHMKNNEMLN